MPAASPVWLAAGTPPGDGEEGTRRGAQEGEKEVPSAPRVCGHRGVRGDSETAGPHGQSLPLLPGQLTPGKGPTGPRRPRPRSEAHTRTTALTLPQPVVYRVPHPNQVCTPPSTGPGTVEEEGPEGRPRPRHPATRRKGRRRLPCPPGLTAHTARPCPVWGSCAHGLDNRLGATEERFGVSLCSDPGQNHEVTARP